MNYIIVIIFVIHERNHKKERFQWCPLPRYVMVYQMNRKWTSRRNPWKHQNKTKIPAKIEAGIRVNRNHIIMILDNYNAACLAIFVGHNLGLQLNLVKNPKLWKCIVFSNIWVFWKQSIVKPKFCLEAKFWKWTSGYIMSFHYCKRSFLPCTWVVFSY